MVRVKRRYVLFEVLPAEEELNQRQLTINEKEILAAIRDAISMIYGDFGLSSVIKSLHLKRFNPQTRIAIITCKRGPHLMLLSAMPFVRMVAKLRCSLRTLHLSGTIRGCLKALRTIHRREIAKIKSQLNQDGKSNQERIESAEKGFAELELNLTTELQTTPQISEES